MDHKRNWHPTFTKGARRRARSIYLLGSRELAERAEGDDSFICRSRGEECFRVAEPDIGTRATSTAGAAAERDIPNGNAVIGSTKGDRYFSPSQFPLTSSAGLPPSCEPLYPYLFLFFSTVLALCYLLFPPTCRP